ncbi:Papilin [Papilio machaon]|uniref:Papilin n=1 Tax=Papilio machaon TaxID=76193 RepID=A0A194QVZ7_PAPMA|nr:Papilin [Papilio machaon]
MAITRYPELRCGALEQSLGSAYAWTSWSNWGPCSRTCGGGVAVQERECLPRKRKVLTNGTIEGSVRIQRADCPGVSRRYHECNTSPCSVGEEVQDMRSEQCAAYDGRPFHGRFYSWVPYIDGNVPCMLNCRPVRQQFYASLGIVADGTPCTKPGYRAICVKGVCKVDIDINWNLNKRELSLLLSGPRDDLYKQGTRVREKPL